ncbi:hypothetical protein ABH991_008121 [Bradyrhizobium ottawaense]|uniref:IS6 family transposase n=1 Tax=Bradyrhizobium ottawaense TaxID=931866 RepID=A0ABV4FJ70_9BRAD
MPIARDPLYRRHRFPPEVISYAVWLYFRVPLSLRMVEEMLAARGIGVTYETVRQWGRKFGKPFSDRIRQRAPARGDKWHLDEVVISIAGEQHCCRPEWLRSRRLDPAPKRLARCPAAHEEALEIRRHAAARDDHGQAPFVRRCEGEDGLSRRTSPAQRSQQSGREFSSADAATRADHEAFQIVPSGSTVSVSSRSGREPFPHPLSRNRHCRLPSCFARTSLCDLARHLHDKRYRRISNL